jgi:tetratricopeptide (TPR) repeat protein
VARTRCLVLLATVALVACASPEERFAQHVERADRLLAQGRADDALIELQGAHKIDPNDAEVNQRIGDLLSAQGSYEPAAFHYAEAYRLDPERVDAALRQAEIVWQTAPRRGARILRLAKQRHPEDARVYRADARFALFRRDVPAALAAARRAVGLAPEAAESWMQLGEVRVMQLRIEQSRGRNPKDRIYREALNAFERADALAGGDVLARIARARVLGTWKGHQQEAAPVYRSAIALAGERGDTGLELRAAATMETWARNTNRTELRREALRSLVAADPARVSSWERLARGVEEMDGAEAAERVYRELLEQQADQPAAHIAFTSHLARAERNGDAIAHLDRVLSKGTDSPLLWEQLLRFELADGRRSDARATYNQMVQRFEDHPATKRCRARIAIGDDRPEEALEVLEGLAADGETVETERLTAIAQLRLGNLPAAQAAIDRSVSLAATYPVSSVRVEAMIQHEAKQWKALLETLAGLESQGQTLSPGERLMRAQAYYEVGRPERGREELESLLRGPIAAPAVALELARREGQRDPEGSRKALARALRQTPGNHELLTSISRLDLRTGHAERAMRRLDKVIESQLAGPRILLLRAELLAQTGELDRAEADALRAFEAAPELPGTIDLLFAIYQAQGKLDDTQRSFEEAEAVGVLHSGARVLLGRLYLAQGEVARAKEVYEKVLVEDPELASAKNDLAFLLAHEGSDLDRALALAEEAQRALPEHPSVADTVGFTYYRMKQNEAALQQFRYAIQLSEAERGESPPGYHYHVGLALAALDRDEEAAAAFERALAIDPEFAESADARRRLEATRQAETLSSNPT